LRCCDLCALCSHSRPHRVLHSFPTRRSSDLRAGPEPPAVRMRPIISIAPPNVSARKKIHARQTRWKVRNHCAAATSGAGNPRGSDRKSTRLNSSHVKTSYAVFCLKKKKRQVSHTLKITKWHTILDPFQGLLHNQLVISRHDVEKPIQII